MNPVASFDPKPYFLRLKGKDYLPVAARLAWLREEHPEAHITTDLLQHDQGKYALFRATITVPNGGRATGWGSETVEDFGDYLEKSETKAIGRAVAALGYGTLHALELDEGDSVADSPVERRPSPVARPTTNGAAKPEQVAWYGQSMKRYGFTNYDDQLAIAEDIGRAPFDQLTAHVLKGIVDAARATLLVRGEDGCWAIAEPVLERPVEVASVAS
jgi:uncharacterized protein YbdZ (MbtH family)